MPSLKKLVKELYNSYADIAAGIVPLIQNITNDHTPSLANCMDLILPEDSKDSNYSRKLKSERIMIYSNADPVDTINTEYRSLEYGLTYIATSKDVRLFEMNSESEGLSSLQYFIFMYEAGKKSKKAPELKNGYISLGNAKIIFDKISMNVEGAITNIRRKEGRLFSRYHGDISTIITCPINSQKQPEVYATVKASAYNVLTAQSSEGAKLRAKILRVIEKVPTSLYSTGLCDNAVWLIGLNK
jgi:hypothetical protein